MTYSTSTKGRRRPALFRALGDADPPRRVEIGGARYRRERILKHDSWACTALYAGTAERVICKFNRQQSIFGLPMAWLGRRLARREMAFYQLLSDLPCIAPPCDAVSVRGANKPMCRPTGMSKGIRWEKPRIQTRCSSLNWNAV